MIITELQKNIYLLLKNQKEEIFDKITGIYYYLDKNIIFPYIFFSINNLKDLSNFSEKIYSATIIINIFDKNINNNFVLDILKKIEDTFAFTDNLNIEKYKTIDIIKEDFKIELENNNTIWKGEISFNIILKKVN